MIISSSHQFFFIHNPKVAGSSIRKKILPYNTSEVELWHQRYIPSLDRIVDMSHLAAMDVQSVLTVPEGYFRFGFIRDVYDRFFSACREHFRQNNLGILQNKKELSAWVLSTLTATSVRFDWNLSHFCPQHYYFYRGNTCVADYIGTYQAIGTDWRTIVAVLDLDESLMSLTKERDSGVKDMVDPCEFLTYDALRRVNSLYVADWFWFRSKLPRGMSGSLETGTHRANVTNTRSAAHRTTFYGEPPGLSLGEKVGFLTSEVERLRRTNP
jgi:hypothetical protein